MSHDTSAPRRLDVSDFDAAQVEAWLNVAGGDDRRAEAPQDEAASEWVVAYTDPRCEEKVEAAMRRRSLDAYVPAMTVTRRRADVRRPVFPRYVFVGLKAGQSSALMAGTPGLFGLVRCGETIERVPAQVIEGLRADEATGVFDFTAARARAASEAAALAAERQRVAEIQPGRRVRMVGGTWAQFSGTVLAHMAGGRVLVEITLFARPMPVPIPLAHVRLVA